MWILRIQRPHQRILENILPDLSKVLPNPEDVFMIAPLPEWNSTPLQEPVYLDGGNRLERANHLRECRGGACPSRRAYKSQNAVQMVRHDHKLVQHQPRKPLWQGYPFSANNRARSAQDNIVFVNGTENGTSPGRTNGHKIDTGKCIVIATQAKTLSMWQCNWIVHLLNVAGRASPAPTDFTAPGRYYSSVMVIG